MQQAKLDEIRREATDEAVIQLPKKRTGHTENEKNEIIFCMIP